MTKLHLITISIIVSSLLVVPSISLAFERQYETSDAYNRIPPKVTALYTKKIKQYGVTLNWEKPARTQYFKVQLLRKNGRNLHTWPTHTKRTRKIQRDDDLLEPGKTYRYRVKSCNSAGCAKWSNKKKFTTLDQVIDEPTDPNVGVDEEVLALEEEVHDLINEYRLQQGLAALTYDENIALIAREHSANMANGIVEFGHDGFSDRYQAMQELYESTASLGAENVAWMTERDNMAEQVKSGWIASEGHRENIERDLTYTGIGIAIKDDRYYFTQLFLKIHQ